eukprot:g1567.t1
MMTCERAFLRPAIYIFAALIIVQGVGGVGIRAGRVLDQTENLMFSQEEADDSVAEIFLDRFREQGKFVDPCKDKGIPDDEKDKCCKAKTGTKLIYEEDKDLECIDSKCPGDSHPSKPTYRLRYKFNEMTRKGYYEFASETSKGMQRKPCGLHGEPERSTDGSACTCFCDLGFMAPYKEQDKNDCSMDISQTINFQVDCFDMPDTFLAKCLETFSSSCSEYRLTWRFECVRTCRAALGVSCYEAKYNELCARDPECPKMCNDMVGLYCGHVRDELLSGATVPDDEEEVEEETADELGSLPSGALEKKKEEEAAALEEER